MSDDLRRVWTGQHGLCAVCSEPVDLADAVVLARRAVHAHWACPTRRVLEDRKPGPLRRPEPAPDQRAKR